MRATVPVGRLGRRRDRRGELRGQVRSASSRVRAVRLGRGDEPGRASVRACLPQDLDRAAVPAQQLPEADRPDAPHARQDGPGVPFLDPGCRRCRRSLRRCPRILGLVRGRTDRSVHADAEHVSAPGRPRAARRPADTRRLRRGDRARPPRRPRDRRSSVRPAAGVPCRGHSLVRARARTTTRRSARGPRRHASRSRRPVRRPLSEPLVRSVGDATRGGDPGGDDGRALRVRPANEGHRRDARHRDPQVDPVAERAGDASLVPLRHLRRAGARTIRRPGEAARAGVHRRDQLEPRREAGRSPGPRDGHAARLHRLPERLQDVTVELGQLVEEQHALVGAGHLAG